MQLSMLGVHDAALLLAQAPPPQRESARLFVTPNIQHIAEMRSSPELRLAMQTADLVTCDGFPLVRFARMRGCAIEGRVTGREVVAQLMRRRDLLAGHRMFFLVEGEETAAAVRTWARRHPELADCVVEIAPQAFGSDRAYCDRLAARMAGCGATLVFLCLGAPRSELFAARYRARVPDCWMLCVGQSVRVALGVVREPPQVVVGLRIEWLWRLWLEPRRLLGRYIHGALGFTLSAVAELWRGPARAPCLPYGPGAAAPALAEIQPAAFSPDPEAATGQGGQR